MPGTAKARSGTNHVDQGFGQGTLPDPPVAPGISRRLGLGRALWLALLLLVAGILGRTVPVEAAVWAGTVLIGIVIAFLNVLLPSLVKSELPSRVSQVTGIYTAVQGAVSAVGVAVVVPGSSLWSCGPVGLAP